MVSRSKAGTYPDALSKRNLETPYSLPFGGKRAVRRADGGAGMGGRKKRMPSCNGADKGPIPWYESALTSDWSFVARRSA